MPQYPDADCLSWALTGQCTVNPRGLAVFCTPECCAEEQTSTTKSAVEDNRTVFIPGILWGTFQAIIVYIADRDAQEAQAPHKQASVLCCVHVHVFLICTR